MTLFTDGINQRPGRNILDEVVTGQLDAAGAAFDQVFFENPTTSARRIGEFRRAEEGRLIYPATFGLPEVRAEPETPMLTAEQARQRVGESGLDITIDDEGIREGVLDILIERHTEQRKRQFILENAPASTMPIQLLAGFGASAIDPINVASGFIPFVGPAKYSSMLANAGSRVGRFGVRARVGAIQGAAGSALVEPFAIYASAQDQTDYGLTDSLLNIAFGTVLGGGLHATGGLLTDMRSSRLLGDASRVIEPTGDTSPLPAVDTPSIQRNALADAIARGDESPMQALRASLERGIAADRQNITRAAGIQAREEIIPQIRAELEAVIAGRSPEAGSLKSERGAIERSLSQLDDSFKPLAKGYQAERMTRKQAERAARDSIAQERQRLNARLAEITDALDTNRQSELARADLARLNRGELPERFEAPIRERVDAIANGFELRQTARAVAEAAPWQVRESALRSAIAQSVTGRPVDVEAIFDLASANKRETALRRLKQPQRAEPDPEGLSTSQRADQALRESASSDELASVQQSVADEAAIAQEMADQVGLDLQPLLRDADNLVRDANTFSAAFRAAAVCQLRN